jgi:hypothetical protein
MARIPWLHSHIFVSGNACSRANTHPPGGTDGMGDNLFTRTGSARRTFMGNVADRELESGDTYCIVGATGPDAIGS